MSSVDIIAAGARLYSDRFSKSLTTGATFTYDVEVSGTDWIFVQAKLAAAAASGDLAVSISPYEDDNVTLSLLTLTPIAAATSGPTLGSGVSRFFGKYDVIGIGRVRITVTNNNAGTKTISGSWRVQGF